MSLLDKLPPELLNYLKTKVKERRGIYLADDTIRWADDVPLDQLGINEELQDLVDYLDRTGMMGVYTNSYGASNFRLNKDFANKIDPDLVTIGELYKQILDKSTYDDQLYSLARGLVPTLRDVTPAFLRNLLKSNNLSRALEKTNNFFDDFGENINDLGNTIQLNSLNDIDRYTQQWQEEERQAADARDIMNYIIEQHKDEFDSAASPEHYKSLRDKYREAALAYRDRPYEYDPRLIEIANKHGWEPFRDLAHQTEVGCQLGHCYGDTKRYGPDHRNMYRDRIRSGNTVLVTNKSQPITAELKFSQAPREGTDIRNMAVGQIMYPNNVPMDKDDPEYPHDLIKELEDIVSDYNGKTIIKSTIVKRQVGDNDREERKLMQAAAGYKDTANVKEQLLKEALADGYDQESAAQLVEQVMRKLRRSETGRLGNKFAKSHNPNKQWANLASNMKRF